MSAFPTTSTSWLFLSSASPVFGLNFVMKSFAVVSETRSYIVTEVLYAKLVLSACVFIYFYNYLFNYLTSLYQGASK